MSQTHHNSHFKPSYLSSFYFKGCVSLIVVLLLSGCFPNNRSTNKLCANNPQICLSLNNNDGQCRHERTDLIWTRFDFIQTPSDLNKFDELLLTKKYAKCMNLVAQIETTTLKSKKTLRAEALFHAYDAIERLEKELKTSYQPAVIYYRWTQGDKEALEQYLKLEETDYLDTPKFQLGLASYYVDTDKEHTVYLLLKGLSLYDGREGETRDKIIPEIIKTLATINHGLGHLNKAYLWALIGVNLELPIANEAQLKLLYPMTDEQRDQMTDIAELIADSIEDGEFNKNNLKLINKFIKSAPNK